MPLSAKDLEKKTEKELDRWRKERPASSFDPRSRCLGYRMAWATTLHNHQEQEKEKLERGNLSVPLSRSSSTLSLSFIPINKRGKGVKGNVGEWVSSGKVVRHVSMGAKDDCRNWSAVHLMKEQDIKKEDVILKESIKQRESLTVHIKQREIQHMDNIKNKTEQRGQEIREGMEEEETKNTDKEIRQCKEPEEAALFKRTGKINAETLLTTDETSEDSLQSREGTTQDHQELDLDTPSEQMQQQTKDQTFEGTECAYRDEQRLDVETSGDPTEGQTDYQTLEDSSQPTEEANQCKQALDYQSQVKEEQKPNGDDEAKEVRDQSAVMVKQMERAYDDAQTEVEEHDKSDSSRQQETEVDVQQTQREVVTEITSETTEESCSNPNTNLKVPPVTDASAGAAQHKTEEKNLEGQNSTAAAPALHTCTEEEALIRKITDTGEVTQQEDTERETKVAQVVQDDEAAQRDREKDSKTGEGTVMILTEKAEQEQVQTEEEQIQMVEEGPQVQQCHEESTLTTHQPGGKGSSDDRKNQEEPACYEVLITVCSNESSPKSSATKAGSHNAQSKESPLLNEQHELRNIQTPSRRNSKSSGDFCIRRSSTSRGSKAGRRLSEDLFTVPHKPTTQPQSTSCQQVHHDKTQSSTVAVKPRQNQRDSARTQEDHLSRGGDAVEKVETQQESSSPQKRLGLFSRLKAEQPKRNKAKRRPNIQVPKILIQDYSDGVTGPDTEDKPDCEEKLSSRERRKRRREQERRQKEDEKLRRKREKELERLMQEERKKLPARSKGLQAESEEKVSSQKSQQAQAGSQANTHVTSYGESYF